MEKLKTYTVDNVRFDIPNEFVAGRYTPIPSDPDEPYSGEYLNDAVVIFPVAKLCADQLKPTTSTPRLVADLPDCPLCVRLFISSRRNTGKPELGETRKLIGGRETFRSDISDIGGDDFVCFRFFVFRTKMVEVHIPARQTQKHWHSLISSIRTARSTHSK